MISKSYYHFTEKFKEQSSETLRIEIANTFHNYSSAESIEGIKRFSSFTSGVFIMNLKKPNLGGRVKVILEQKIIDIKGQHVLPVRDVTHSSGNE